jgi:hypothetical protein
MRRIISVLVLLGILSSVCADAYAWKPRLLRKMTKPPLCQKHAK